MITKELWEAGRRQFVIDCLANNEFPYRGWDVDYPDLAVQRLRELERVDLP